MPAKLSLDVKVNHMGLMEDDYPRGFQVLNCESRGFRGTSLQSRKTVGKLYRQEPALNQQVRSLRWR